MKIFSILCLNYFFCLFFLHLSCCCKYENYSRLYRILDIKLRQNKNKKSLFKTNDEKRVERKKNKEYNYYIRDLSFFT